MSKNIAFLENKKGPREMMMRGLNEKNTKKYIKSMKRKRIEEPIKPKEQS